MGSDASSPKKTDVAEGRMMWLKVGNKARAVMHSELCCTSPFQTAGHAWQPALPGAHLHTLLRIQL